MQHMLRARMSRADQGLAVAGADARPAGPPKGRGRGLASARGGTEDVYGHLLEGDKRRRPSR